MVPTIPTAPTVPTKPPNRSNSELFSSQGGCGSVAPTKTLFTQMIHFDTFIHRPSRCCEPQGLPLHAETAVIISYAADAAPMEILAARV